MPPLHLVETDGEPTSPCGRHFGIWLTLLTMGSALLVAGIGAGIALGRLDTLVSDLSQQYHDEKSHTQQALNALSVGVNNLSVSVSQLSGQINTAVNRITDVSNKVDLERQDRLEGERRILNFKNR